MKTDVIAKYAKKMTEDLVGAPGGLERILWKDGKRCYATRRGADLTALTEADIEELTGKAAPEVKALMGNRSAQAMVIARPPYCLECVARRREIPAALDDMAEIIGPKAELVRYEERPLTAALRRSSGVLVKASRKRDARGNTEMPACAITVGRSPYEACVAMGVLEKAAAVTLKADVLGGVKTLPLPVAMAAHRIYRNQYSEAERKFRDEETR